MAGRPLRGYAVVVNVKIPSLAAALVLTAAAAQAQFATNDFSAIETMGAYDPPLQWASKDCQHAPCALANEPGKTASVTAAVKQTTFDAPLYNPTTPAAEEGKNIAQLMARMNASGDAGQDALPGSRAATPANDAVPNAATIVHVGRVNHYDNGAFTFKKTIEAAAQMKQHQDQINTPGKGFAAPGETLNPNEGTSSFIQDPRPTRVFAQ